MSSALFPSRERPAGQPGATAYPDVNAALEHVLGQARAVLGERFRGMYLDGSLALGDFDPRRSDVDFVVVTDADLPDAVFAALQAVHARFGAGASPWATEIEASYIPQDALRRYAPPSIWHPRIQRGGGRLAIEEHAIDWLVHRYIMREHGVALAGPDPRTLIDPVSPQDLQQAMVSLMQRWWAPMICRPARLRHRGYQVYAVLTMCRVLFTLATGRVASKPASAGWARRSLDPRFSGVIDRALAWDKTCSGEASDADRRETLALIRYTASRCLLARRTPLPSTAISATPSQRAEVE